jgi:hypothetical protein
MEKLFIVLVSGISLQLAGFSQQNVGIGTNTPNYPLTVIAPTGGKGIVQKTGDVEVGFYTVSTQAFIQTWSNHPLYFTTNNGAPQMMLNTLGNLGIGTSTPTTRLDVNGQLRIRGGDPAAGKVLTSDANGLATWQAAQSIKTTQTTLSTSPILNHGTFSIVPFENNNDGSFADLPGFDNSNNQFVVTEATAGTYLITAQVTWDILNSFTGEKDFNLELRNGLSVLVTNRMISQYLSTFINTTQRSQQITCTLKLTAGQQIKLAALQRTGVSQNIVSDKNLTYFSLTRLY